MLKFFCTLAAIIILTSNLAFAKPAPDKTKIKPIETTQNILPKHEHTEKCNLTSAEPVQIICILDRSGSMSFKVLLTQRPTVPQSMRMYSDTTLRGR